MATTLLLTNTPSGVTGLPETEYDAWTSRGDAAVSETGIGDTDGVIDLINDVNGTIFWFSKPLAAVTIAGSITFNMRMAESAMTTNNGAAVRVIRANGAGAEISTLLTSSHGVEMTTAETARNWAATPTSTAFADGDRLLIKCGATEVGAGAANIITLWFDGPSSGASGDSFLTFTETLTEFVAAADRVPRFSPYPQLLAH